MSSKEVEYRNFEHILRHTIDKNGLTFITVSHSVQYERLNMQLDNIKPFILKDSRTIVTTTRSLDMAIVRYCYENNLRVETVSLYSTKLNTNIFARLPKKINKCIVLGNKINKVTESITKYYSNFTTVYKFKI